jgi:hypothetical protein
METQIEITDLDLRYENHRLKSPGAEKIMLNSILEKGIRDPLQGVDTRDHKILLDGFKRYRCAKKLNIAIVPYISLGNDEALAIIQLIRLSNAKSLSIVEQARWIDELKNVCLMSTADIARMLEKSKSWVSMRSGLIAQMTDCVKDNIFKGKFPVYSYMYTLRQFMRMNGNDKKEIDQFVESVAGKGLSTRDIELLAHGYFKGSDEFRQQIRSGNLSWSLKSLRESSQARKNCTEVERAMLTSLEVTQKYMQRLIVQFKDNRYQTGDFYAQANLLSGGILRQLEAFAKGLRGFHDQSGQA